MSTTGYDYVAVDRQGHKVRGTLRGASEAQVLKQITAQGLTPLRIRPERQNRIGSRRIRRQDIAQFTYQLAVLINARVPIGEGIRSIAEQEQPGRFRDMLTQMAIRIESGDRIAQAMAEHEHVLGPVYVQTVHAAEQSGNLVKVLEYLSDMTERQQEMRQQVRGALMYPACVMVVLTLATTFLVAFVVPKFAAMFQSRGIELPIFTRAVMTLGQGIQLGWPLILLALVGGVWGLRHSWRKPSGRRFIERALHQVPYLGKVLTGIAVARFARVFGVSLSSGLPLLDALGMAGRASGAAMLLTDVDRLIDQVRTGSRMSGALGMVQYMPPFAKRMLISGEESAELPKMCGVIARHYERETSVLTKNVSTAIEPVLIVLIAAMVLAIALAIFLPMWNMVQVMER